MFWEHVACTMLNKDRREANTATDSLSPYFLNAPDSDKGIDADFLQEAVNRFAEDDTPKMMLRKAFAGLSFQLSTMNMSNNYKPYVEVRSYAYHPNVDL